MAAAASPAAAQEAMTVAQFLARAAPLEKMGVAGLLLSGHTRKLRNEIGAAAEAVRAEDAAARRGGRMPSTCLPPKGKAQVRSDELLAYLRAIPAERRNVAFRPPSPASPHGNIPAPRASPAPPVSAAG